MRLKVCMFYRHVFRGTEKTPQYTVLYKKGIDSRSFSLLLTIWLLLKSPNSPSSSLNAKVVSEFSFSQRWMWKTASSPTPSAPLCLSYRDPQREGLCFVERSSTVCAAEPHLSLCQSALCICSAGARFASACQFFKRKASAFQISGGICFSKSARQADQIRFHLYWTWT